ncbi:MAG: hypothetical protein KatS3mg114_0946 [Planctomycetaceae bacterium]|jgi:hypothetical protein|nr:MAG: hypothetical protein KatS3mg114_0946 [Planctomycetaceae bacterium]
MTALAESTTNVSLLTHTEFHSSTSVFSEFNILLVEHRDEVFARLQRDLYDLGIGTYRATSPEELFKVHSRIPIGLTLANSRLPHSSVWLTTAKLRIYMSHARIWVYLARPTSQERVWAKLARIERVLSYDGSLFQLAERVQCELCGFGTEMARAMGHWREAC